MSLLIASGEKARCWLGRTPTSSDVPPAPPVRDQPAVVGYARRGDQRPAVGARGPREQLPEAVLGDPAGLPMTAVAQAPCAVTSEVASGAAWTATMLGGAAGAACEPQPTTRAVPQPGENGAHGMSRAVLCQLPASPSRAGQRLASVLGEQHGERGLGARGAGPWVGAQLLANMSGPVDDHRQVVVLRHRARGQVLHR